MLFTELFNDSKRRRYEISQLGEVRALLESAASSMKRQNQENIVAFRIIKSVAEAWRRNGTSALETIEQRVSDIYAGKKDSLETILLMDTIMHPWMESLSHKPLSLPEIIDAWKKGDQRVLMDLETIVSACNRNASDEHLVWGDIAAATPENDEPGRSDKKALYHYCLALMLDPTNTSAMTSYAVAMMEQGYFGKALELFETALHHKPDDPRIMTAIGVCYKESGQTGRARQVFREIIELHPDYPSAYFFLGHVFEDMGYTVEAGEYAGMAYDLSRNRSNPYYDPEIALIIRHNNASGSKQFSPVGPGRGQDGLEFNSY